MLGKADLVLETLLIMRLWFRYFAWMTSALLRLTKLWEATLGCDHCDLHGSHSS